MADNSKKRKQWLLDHGIALLITIIGGIIVAYVIQEGARFAPVSPEPVTQAAPEIVSLAKKALVSIVIGVWLLCFYIAFKRTPPLIDGGRGTWQYPRFRKPALYVALGLPILSLLLLSIFWIPRQSNLFLGRSSLPSDESYEDLYAAVGLDKTEVFPGQDISVSLHLTNEGEEEFHNVIAVVVLPEGVTYKPGSGRVTIASGSVHEVDDNWVKDRVNVGSIPPNGTILLRFDAHIPRDLSLVGQDLGFVLQVKPAEPYVWILREDTATVVWPEKVSEIDQEGFFSVRNLSTSGDAGWHEEVIASPGDTLEFRVRISNVSNYAMRGIQLNVKIPWDPQSPKLELDSTSQVHSNNMAPTAATINVRLETPAYLWPTEYHFLFGSTDLYPCDLGCPLNSGFLHYPFPLGTLKARSWIEVIFRVDVLEKVD